jgi:uncharacterized protein with HEPN domain
MPQDDAYLLDIVLAAREVQQLAATIDQRSFEESRVHQLAFMKLLQDIGEAANRLSPATRAGLPAVPWPEIIGLRNRLVHDYRGIDLELVWETIAQDIEPLLAAIEPLIPPEAP